MSRCMRGCPLVLALACSLGGGSATPAGAYALSRYQDPSNSKYYGTRWKSLSQPIKFMLNDGPASMLPNLLGDSLPTAAVQASMRTWSFAPIGMTLAGTSSKTSVGLDGVNLISLANTADNRDLVGNNIAVTQFWLNAHGNLPYWPMREADVIFNPAAPIATDGRPKAFDLQAVLTHEMGHALGLDHSSIPAATMWPYGDQGETRDRTPDADDVAAVQATYGTLSDATHGTISGRVLAAGDVPVFGATVVATDEQGVARCGAFTERDGSYTLSWLPPSLYSVHAETLNTELTTGLFSGDYYHNAWRDFPTAFLGGNNSPMLVQVKPGDAVAANPIRVSAQRPRLAIQVLGSAPDGQNFTQFGLQALTLKPGASTYLLVAAEGLTAATEIQGSGTDLGFDTGNEWVDQLSDGTPFAFLSMSVRPGAVPGARNLYLSTNSETSAFSGAIKVLAP